MELIRRSSDYALRSLVHMACFPRGEIFSLDSLAGKVDVSPVFMAKLFQKLCRSGIVVSHRGIKGGFSLGLEPGKVSMASVVEVIQGPVFMNKCLEKKNVCKRAGNCSLRNRLDVLQRELDVSLAEISLEELAEDEKRRSSPPNRQGRIHGTRPSPVSNRAGTHGRPRYGGAYAGLQENIGARSRK